MAGEHEAPKSGFTAKDWLLIAIALCALLVSAGNAYISVIQKVEHASVTIRYPPLVNKRGDKLVVRDKEYSAVFVNSGNRPVVIFGLNVLFIQHKDRMVFSCFPDMQEAAAGEFETNLEPFVVKENEIAIKSFSIGARHPYGYGRIEGPDANAIPIMNEVKGHPHISIEVCLDVELSTPTIKRYSQRVSIIKFDVAESGSFYGDDVALLTPNVPGVLIDRKVTIFGW